MKQILKLEVKILPIRDFTLRKEGWAKHVEAG
jgi:hypothetical protein